MFMPSYPYFVKKRRKKRKSCCQDKAYFSTRGNEIQIKTIIHLVLIKRQQNARIISEVWSWLGGMLCHHHTSAGFPSSFPSMPNDVSSLAFCCSTSRAALPSCPASLGGSSWCSWEHQPHHTEQNQQPQQCLGCVFDIQEHPKLRCQTIQTQSKHSNNSRSVGNSCWSCWCGILWQPKAWT